MAARNATDPYLWWHLKDRRVHRPSTDPFLTPIRFLTPAPDSHGSLMSGSPSFFSRTRSSAPQASEDSSSSSPQSSLRRSCLDGAAAPLRIAGIATLLAVWATMPIWGVRPQILSLLLTSLWLLMLDRSERNPKLLWWTLPAHSSLGESARRIRRRLGSVTLVPRWRMDRTRARPLAAAPVRFSVRSADPIT